MGREPIYHETEPKIHAHRKRRNDTMADDASPANPWDRMLQHDERWNRKGPLRMMKADFLTVLVLVGVGALVIGAVLLLK